MPNGGPGHCGNCCYFDAGDSHCTLRNVAIESAHWTTCRSRNSDISEIQGPVYAIVCEVRNGATAYGSIPYYDGCRVDTVQPPGGGNTVLRFIDSQGESREFASVAQYMGFFENSGQQA